MAAMAVDDAGAAAGEAARAAGWGVALPLVPQRHTWDCGLACAATVLAYAVAPVRAEARAAAGG
jgi:hypothetical protein